MLVLHWVTDGKKEEKMSDHMLGMEENKNGIWKKKGRGKVLSQKGEQCWDLGQFGQRVSYKLG